MPPATATSRSPARTAWSTMPAERMPEAHTLFTVSEETSLGMPPLIWACRDGTCPCPAWSTWPNTTCCTWSGATAARSSACSIAWPPRSVASSEASAPPIFPKGVRAVPRITVLGMVEGVSLLLRGAEDDIGPRRRPVAVSSEPFAARCVSTPMKRSTALAAAALATACAIPATAPAQKPPTPAPGAVSLTLGAAPNPVLAGRILTLSGRLTADKMANQKVDLTSDPFPFDKLGKAGTATTNAAGDFQLIQRPTANTRYQARKGQGESALVTVLVRPRVGLRLSDSTPSAGQRVRFSGRVCPEHDGTTMAIQRRSGGRFNHPPHRATGCPGLGLLELQASAPRTRGRQLSHGDSRPCGPRARRQPGAQRQRLLELCLLYTSDAADDLLCVDLGGRRI